MVFRERSQFLKIFLPISVIVGGLLAAIYWSQERIVSLEIEARELARVELQTKLINQDLIDARADLFTLARLLGSKPNLSDRYKQEVTARFLEFLKGKSKYDQVRWIFPTDRDLIKIRFLKDNPIVSKPQKTSDYRKLVMNMGGNQVFVSSWQPKSRNSTIHKPLEPIITYSIKVFGKEQELGILTLDLLGTTIAKNINQNCLPITQSLNTQCSLVDAKGVWLQGETSDQEWGNVLSDRQDQRFGNRFPEAWQQISTQTSGQFQTLDGIFTFRTICPNPVNSDNCGPWKLIARYPSVNFGLKNRSLAYSLLGLYLSLILLIAFTVRKFIGDRQSRQLIEQEMQKTAAKFKQLYDKAPCGYHSLDSQLVYVDINDTELAMLGYDRTELVGRLKFTDILTAESIDSFQSSLANFVETGELNGLQVQIICKRGEILDVALDASIVYKSNGEFETINYNMIDISDHQKIKQETKEREQAIRTLYDITADPKLNFSDRLGSILTLGRYYFGFNLGVTAKLDGDHYEILLAETNEGQYNSLDSYLNPHSESELNNIYVEVMPVLESIPTTIVNRFMWRDHPEHNIIQAENFIAARVFSHGEIYGIIGFANVVDLWKILLIAIAISYG